MKYLWVKMVEQRLKYSENSICSNVKYKMLRRKRELQVFPSAICFDYSYFISKMLDNSSIVEEQKHLTFHNTLNWNLSHTVSHNLDASKSRMLNFRSFSHTANFTYS